MTNNQSDGDRSPTGEERDVQNHIHNRWEVSRGMSSIFAEIIIQYSGVTEQLQTPGCTSISLLDYY